MHKRPKDIFPSPAFFHASIIINIKESGYQKLLMLYSINKNGHFLSAYESRIIALAHGGLAQKWRSLARTHTKIDKWNCEKGVCIS
jgi:hypothetical protein